MQRSRLAILIFLQALLCWLESYLISKISFIGRVGIATIHKEYRLLRSGWKTFLLLFGIQLAIILVLNGVQKRSPRKFTVTAAIFLLLIAVMGLFMTFDDFLHTYTHRLLKERFHLGFYLFWLGWIGTCVIFLVRRDDRKTDDPPFPLDPNTPSQPTADPDRTNVLSDRTFPT